MNKRWICLVFISIFMFLLCGCHSKNDMSNYKIENISEISLVNVDADGNITVLHTLNAEQSISFLEDFSKLKCYTYWNDPVQDFFGDNIRITLNDGSYYMIGCFCTAYCSGNRIKYDRKYYSADEFDNLWFKYLNIES